jgi:hypothetical protein
LYHTNFKALSCMNEIKIYTKFDRTTTPTYEGTIRYGILRRGTLPVPIVSGCWTNIFCFKQKTKLLIEQKEKKILINF